MKNINKNKVIFITIIIIITIIFMNVALNGELLQKVECFKCLGAKIIVDGGMSVELTVYSLDQWLIHPGEKEYQQLPYHNPYQH